MTAVLEQLHRLAASMGGSRRSGQDQLASAVDEAISNTGRLVAEAGTGTGKALALDTPIPTPTGWAAMGDLRVGDVVFDETGHPCNITHAHPVRNDRPCFEVEFSDGEIIVADEDHLWATATRAARRNRSRERSAARVSSGSTTVLDRCDADTVGPLEVITTRQMFDTLLTERGERNHAVPVAASLQMPDVELPIDPYLLGVWLGNGHSESGMVTAGYHDRAAVAELVTPLWEGTVTEYPDRSAVRFRFGQPHPDECPYGHSDWTQANTKVNRICATCTSEANGVKRDRTRRTNQGLTELLRLHGLFGNKHIPVSYARASVAQRLSLLQGLMDTDGFVDRRGFCEATFTRELLALDTVELIRSLGIKASIKSSPAAITENGTRRIVGTRWRIVFRPGVCVFRMPRKAARWHSASATRKASVGLFRYVVDVRPTASVPVRCITVDSASHLFLAGRAMVPTHNSFGYLVPAAMSGKRTLVITSGLALQDQIVGSDLPAIRRVLDPTLTFTSLKGRSNYACVQKAAEAIAFRTPSLRSAAAWVLDDDSDGLKERRLAPAGTTDETWSALTIGHDECPGVKVCPSGKRCAAATARRVATESRIVVANMHLLGAWLVNGELPEPKDANGDVLEGGRFETIVVDEAHDLDDIACSANGSAVSGWMLRRVANDFAAAHLTLPAADLRRLARVLDAECDRIGSQRFDSIASASDFESILVEAASVLDEGDFPDGPAGQRMKAKAAALTQQLTAVVAADGDTDVIWCDGSAIHTQPRSVAGLLARNVWNQRAVVITSATMPRKIITDIGLKLRPRSEPVPEVAMLRCASPFDYRRQSVLYLPSGLPRPGTAHWDQAAGDECVRLVEASDGGALVLCTSMAAVARFADRLTAEGFRVHSQQPGSQKEALIKAFADDYNSVLVATRSFWQGVDVPGRSLRLVVIDRVPFPRPDEWVIDARRETAAHRMVVSAGLDWDEAKKQAFHHVDVPLAATALAQAAGRLIRSVADTGVVAILDGRLETARYASAVLAALPPMWRTTDFEAVRSAMSKFAVAS